MSNSDSSSGTLTLRVRYSECDPMGVAHHTAYPVWFEMGRTELLRESKQNFSYRDLETMDIFLAVVNLNITYKRPARYDDLLTLETTITEAGHVKLKHAYKLFRGSEFRGQELLTTATTTLACLNRQGKPQPLPSMIIPK